MMTQKSVSVILRILCVISLIAVVLMSVFLFRILGKVLKDQGTAAVIFKAVIVICALLVATAVLLAWAIFSDIGRGQSFTLRNAKRLKAMSLLFAFVALAALVPLTLIVISELGYLSLIFSIVVVFVAISFCVICLCLSYLIKNGADIEEENRLTV
jgi:hypothetical protein